MKVDVSKLYNKSMNLHAALPYFFLKSKAFPPLRVSIMLTYKCNLSCKMCFQIEIRKSDDHIKELSYEEVINIIDQMHPNTLITLTGGEPFVRTDISEIIKYACKKNFCNILTNATLLDEKDIILLIENKVKLLGISLDGLYEVHDSIRGVKGSFDKTISSIKLIQKYKKLYKKKYPLIDIKVMILKENISEIYKIVQLASELNVDFITLSIPFGKYPFNPKSVRDINQFMKTGEWGEFKEFYKIDNLDKINKFKDKIKIRFYPEINIEQENILFSPDNFSPCKLPWSHFWISPIGEVFPCLPYLIGNVRDNTLKELLNCKSFKDFRNCVKSHGIIEGCYGCCYLKSRQ